MNPTNSTAQFIFYVKAKNVVGESGEAEYATTLAGKPSNAVVAHPNTTIINIIAANQDMYPGRYNLVWNPVSDLPQGLTVKNYTVEYFNMYEWGQSPKVIHNVDSEEGKSSYVFKNFQTATGADAHLKNQYKFKVKVNYSDGKSSSYSEVYTYNLLE